MTAQQTHTEYMIIVADALAATPEVTNLTYAREDCHSDVQFHCHIDGEPTDVTVLANRRTPAKALQTAYYGTTRDINHCIITPDKQTGTRIRRWLQAPVAEASTDAIQLYTHNQLNSLPIGCSPNGRSNRRRRRLLTMTSNQWFSTRPAHTAGRLHRRYSTNCSITPESRSSASHKPDSDSSAVGRGPCHHRHLSTDRTPVSSSTPTGYTRRLTPAEALQTL